MPRQQGLWRRGARYYTNIKVPKDLREALGKEHIRESLKTSDPREAAKMVAIEVALWKTRFEEERRKLKQETQPQGIRQRLLALTKKDAFDLAFRFLIQREESFRTWWDQDGIHRSEPELERAINSNLASADAYGEGADYEALDGSSLVTDFLNEEGYECPPTSPAFEMLRPLLRAAEREHALRCLDILHGEEAQARDTHFREVFANTTPPEAKKDTTLAELLERYTAELRALKRSPATFSAYEMPFRLLRETLGTTIGLSSITKASIKAVWDVLENMPQNSMQRYPRLPLPEAVKAADKANDTRRVKKRTQSNYYNTIVVIFNFAVEEKLMEENPANDRRTRERFEKEHTPPKQQFSIHELNQLFRAPLYVGCVDDKANYAEPGGNHPKRGRYWVPLLGLFQGMRCNEACQLFTEDVKERNGITYLSIRGTREDGSASEKRLKTTSSIREVPIHPTIELLGFLQFVEERRKDTSSPRLFPELEGGSTGYFSNPFSKWFGRFVESVLGDSTKATFHSFRHQFRDACRAARLPEESVAMLAGWEQGKGKRDGVMNHYGRGAEYFRLLKEDLAKVQYPGLDLAHLMPAPFTVRRSFVRDRD